MGDAYDVCRDGDIVCVTTNGEVKVNGRAVMGRGCAEFVAKNFNGTDKKLAEYLKTYGNRVFNLGKYSHKGHIIRIVSFPTKNLWRDKSSLDLIEKSAKELLLLSDKLGANKIFIPIPGCSNGKLKWSQVRERLIALDERFTVYSTEPELFLH